MQPTAIDTLMQQAHALTRSYLSLEVKILNKEFWARYNIGEYGSPMAAAFDLRACIDEPVEISRGNTALIPTGLAMYINDPDYALLILPRSGLGNKGLVLGNGTGLIDPDYQGELKISAWNRLNDSSVIENPDDALYVPNTGAIVVNPGDRIAQAVLVPVMRAGMRIVDEFSDATDRGTGGFGHSGIR